LLRLSRMSDGIARLCRGGTEKQERIREIQKYRRSACVFRCAAGVSNHHSRASVRAAAGLVVLPVCLVQRPIRLGVNRIARKGTRRRQRSLVRPHTAIREMFVDTAVEACIRCGASLSQDAKFCSQCGQGVAVEVSNSQLRQTSPRQAIGLTRFFFRRTAAEIVVKAAVTNEAAQVFAEVIQTLATDKLLRTPRLSDFAAEEDQDLDPVETTAQIHPGIEAPSAPAQQSAPAETGSGIEWIFGIRNGAPRLEHHILKAKDLTEYARRLIRLFVHYMVHHGGVEEVGRNDLYRFLDAVGISGNNYRPLVSRDQSLSRKKDPSNKLDFIQLEGMDRVGYARACLTNSPECATLGWEAWNRSRTRLWRRVLEAVAPGSTRC
jgi:zinc-ribbon domain